MTASLHRMSRNPEATPILIEVDGTIVPYIECREIDGRYSLTIMRPGDSPLLGMDVDSEDELLRWAPMLANAMAVAAGRTSHGEHSRPHNPHGANWFFEDGPHGAPRVDEVAEVTSA